MGKPTQNKGPHQKRGGGKAKNCRNSRLPQIGGGPETKEKKRGETSGGALEVAAAEKGLNGRRKKGKVEREEGTVEKKKFTGRKG